MNARSAFAFLGAVSVLYAQDQPAKPKADVIFVHGNVYTGVAMTSQVSKARSKSRRIIVRTFCPLR